MFKAVESYFRQGAGNDTSKVSPTALPPIYFQHRGESTSLLRYATSGDADSCYIGHSLTIVGFERSKEGQPNLLVFDPSFRDSSVVRGLVGRTVRQPESKVGNMLDAYRRGNKYLCKYSEFEVL